MSILGPKSSEQLPDAPAGHELAHFNLAIGKAPLDHPSMTGFVDQIDAVNRLAEASPGFVWTPTGNEAGDALAIFGNPLVLANLSTWRSLEDLRRFVCEGQHGKALAHRLATYGPTAHAFNFAQAFDVPNP